MDASHEKFRDVYMETLKHELIKRGRSLDYVDVSHTEPDHSGKKYCCAPIKLDMPLIVSSALCKHYFLADVVCQAGQLHSMLICQASQV